MKKLDYKKIKEFDIMLKNGVKQENVIKQIPQFYQVDSYNYSLQTPKYSKNICPLVFNMERGVNIDEIAEFLQYSKQLPFFDVIFANELDDECTRSGNINTAEKLARKLNMNCVFGLEFIELEDIGFHGNAIFSRWDIIWAKTIRLSQEYNWYNDKQKRIGGRCAIFACINVNGQKIGLVSIHLENRTDGYGRFRQMNTILKTADQLFGDIPIILGGDLNTNTFDGRDKKEIINLAKNPNILKKHIKNIHKYEPLIDDCQKYGYMSYNINDTNSTRRKLVPDYNPLHLKLDWIFAKKCEIEKYFIISTKTSDLCFDDKAIKLSKFNKDELSDHDIVYSQINIERGI